MKRIDLHMSRMISVGLFRSFVLCLLVACNSLPPAHIQVSENPNDQVWKTYTSSKYSFKIDYPAHWQYLEVPTVRYPTGEDQIWFFSSELPSPQTGARAYIVIIMNKEDPSPNWQPEFFDQYQSEDIQLGNLSAIRITGVNKESGYAEIAVITKIGDVFILAMPNLGVESMEYFDQVVT